MNEGRLSEHLDLIAAAPGHPETARHHWCAPAFAANGLLICRSGKRLAEACEALITHGIKHVFNFTHGFEGDIDDVHHRGTVNGWRFDGLPLEQC